MPTIREIIRRAGGEDAITSAAKSAGEHLTGSAVRYWVRNGIPRRWYSLVSQLSGCELETIHTANEGLEAARRLDLSRSTSRASA